MFRKSFFRKISCILLMLALITLLDEVVYGTKKDESSEEKPAITEAELQSHVMSFADRFAAIMVTSFYEFESKNPPKKSRSEVLGLVTYSISNAYIIAGESDPDVALLDIVCMVTLGRIIFEEEGPLRYGKTVQPITDGFRMAEKDIREIAAIVLMPDQLTELMSSIKRWRKENLKLTFFPQIRFGDFAAGRRQSQLTRAERKSGLFKSVEAATEQVEEMRLLAERGMYLGTRMPLLSGLFGDLWLTRVINNPNLQKVLTDVAQLSEGTAGLAAIAEKLPDQIANEREATIKQLMGEVTAIRKATMADFLAEFQSIEQRLISEITKVMDRAESEGEQLVDHTMRQAIVLIGIWLVGYVIARLIIQFFSNRMRGSTK